MVGPAPEVIGPGEVVYWDEYEGGDFTVGPGGIGYSPDEGWMGDVRWLAGDYYGGPYRRWYTPLRGRLWVRGEYLLWWTEGFRVPPLVTTSPFGTARADAGVLGKPGTSVLFGDDRLNNLARSGGRINFGYWLGPRRLVCLETAYFGLAEESTTYRPPYSTGDPILARPFFNIQPAVPPQRQDASLVAFTDYVEGSVAVDASTDLQSVEVLLRRALVRQYDYRLDFLVGWRFARLKDDLRISESTTALRLHPAPGTITELYDHFGTKNKFNGAEFGLVAQKRRFRWSLEMLMKLAVGGTCSRVNIDASTITTVPPAPPNQYDGGLLALDTNIGSYKQNHLSVIPELGVTVGYDLTPHLRATFGYTFLYWSRVARPGDQIDFDVNETYFPPPAPAGAPRPEFKLVTDDLWAQGLNFGLDYRF